MTERDVRNVRRFVWFAWLTLLGLSAWFLWFAATETPGWPWLMFAAFVWSQLLPRCPWNLPPFRTAESVARELVEGLDNGTLTLPEQGEEES